MMIKRTKEWWLAKARLEGNSEVGAGSPAFVQQRERFMQAVEEIRESGDCACSICANDQAALDYTLFLMRRETLVEALLDKVYSHFFHPDVTTAQEVQEAAEAVRDFVPAAEEELS